MKAWGPPDLEIKSSKVTGGETPPLQSKEPAGSARPTFYFKRDLTGKDGAGDSGSLALKGMRGGLGAFCFVFCVFCKGGQGLFRFFVFFIKAPAPSPYP